MTLDIHFVPQVQCAENGAIFPKTKVFRYEDISVAVNFQQTSCMVQNPEVGFFVSTKGWLNPDQSVRFAHIAGARKLLCQQLFSPSHPK